MPTPAAGLIDAVQERGDQSRLGIEPVMGQDVQACHREKHPQHGRRVEGRPVELPGGLEDSGVRPEQEWRLAFDRVSIRSPAVDDLVGDDRVHGLVVDRP
jgi:hypothetical protein